MRVVRWMMGDREKAGKGIGEEFFDIKFLKRGVGGAFESSLLFPNQLKNRCFEFKPVAQELHCLYSQLTADVNFA